MPNSSDPLNKNDLHGEMVEVARLTKKKELKEQRLIRVTTRGACINFSGLHASEKERLGLLNSGGLIECLACSHSDLV